MTTPPNIFAIDPGCTETAWLEYEPAAARIVGFGKIPNPEMLRALGERQTGGAVMVIESVACYGMAVGWEVFETVFWSGQFWHAWYGAKDRLYRKDVKLSICKDSRANDTAIRRALMDRFGGDRSVKSQQCPTCKGTRLRGKAKTPCGCGDGWKIKPGPLVGITRDVWAALGVACAYADGARSRIKGVGAE